MTTPNSRIARPWTNRKGLTEAEFLAEKWRPVVGFEWSHEVSDFGRVRSLGREVTSPRSGKPFVQYIRQKLLAPQPNSNGYPSVSLGGIFKTVHKLVLTAFVGPRPHESDVCRHLDGSRTNNRLGNLKWGTEKENRADADRHGRSLRGEMHPRAKLNEKAVRKIRSLGGTVTQSALAAQFGVARCTIQAVLHGEKWKHITS